MPSIKIEAGPTRRVDVLILIVEVLALCAALYAVVLPSPIAPLREPIGSSRGGRVVALVDLTAWGDDSPFPLRRRPTLSQEFVKAGCDVRRDCATVQEGDRVSVLCEAEGERVTDQRGRTSALWGVIEHTRNVYGLLPSLLLTKHARRCTPVDLVEVVAATASRTRRLVVAHVRVVTGARSP